MTVALSLFDPFDFETNFSAAATCFNNVGPGFNEVGPAGSFAVYSDFSTLLLSFAMLLGRLEIYPILLAFAPATYFSFGKRKVSTHFSFEKEKWAKENQISTTSK